MKIYVYCLKNCFNAEIYVGITNNVQRRLHEHNSGRNRYTKAFIPWDVFYTEEYEDYAQARSREKYLKSAAGKRFLKKQLQ